MNLTTVLNKGLICFLATILIFKTSYSQNYRYSRFFPYNFNVELKNGNSFTTNSLLWLDKDTKKKYVLYNKEKIFPEYTNKIYFIYNRDTIFGFPRKYSWLFRDISGEIKCYSYVPIIDDDFMEKCIREGKGNVYLNWKDTVFIKASTPELEKLLLHKPDAYEYYRKKQKLFRLSGWGFGGCLVGGVAMVFIGAFNNNNALATTGAVVSGASVPFFVLLFPSRNYRVKAIRKYNQIDESKL